MLGSTRERVQGLGIILTCASTRTFKVILMSVDYCCDQTRAVSVSSPDISSYISLSAPVDRDVMEKEFAFTCTSLHPI